MVPRHRTPWILMVGILALLAGAGARAPGRAAPAPPGHEPDAYVLVVGDPGQVRAALQAAGGEERFALSDGSIAVRVPSAQLATLSKAPGIRQVLPDDAVAFTDGGDTNSDSQKGSPETSQAFEEAVHAPEVWAKGADGSKVAVAVLDTGIRPRVDSKTRIVAAPFGADDTIGHGTFVAGLIAGSDDNGFRGIAPDANLINVKVVGADGVGHTSDLIRGIDWAVQNRARYNIRVLNISATASTPSSYLTNALDAAVERAWFSGIVVVVAAGNSGPSDKAMSVAPADDPFVITVGAFDDAGTAAWADDSLASWSSSGATLDKFVKPDVVAPGRHLISWLATGNPLLAQELPARIVDKNYIQLSGTSAAAPVVAGVAALILDKNPNLTPDQVKARLTGSAQGVSNSAAPRIDAYTAVFGGNAGSANQGTPINLLLAAAAGKFDLKRIPASTNWSSLNLGTITWDPVKWDPVKLQSITWDSITWDSITWDAITWDSITWDVIHFDVVGGD
jgi:serine protease AprX